MLEFRIDQNMVCSSQPDQSDLERCRAEGFRTVVDLRTAGEEGHPPDEKEQVERLGMSYVAFPVDGGTQLTVKRAREFRGVLRAVEWPVLIHCGSANRVGALLALGVRHEEGRSVEASIGFGKKAGLAASEQMVRALM